MASRRPVRTALILVLPGLGVAISYYLFARSVTLLKDPEQLGGDFCSITFQVSCDPILLSPGFWQLGIPIAGWGIVYFSTLLSLGVIATLLEDPFQRVAGFTLMPITFVGAAFSVLLAWTMFSNDAFCPLCAIAQLLSFPMLGLSFKMIDTSMSKVFSGYGRAIKEVLQSANVTPETASRFLGLFAVLLIATVSYQWTLIQWERQLAETERQVSRDDAIADYAVAPVQEIRLSGAEPARGAEQPKVRLVVFSSLECPGCRQFVTDMAAVESKFKNELQVVFKHFPLGIECNSVVEVDLQPASCSLAYAAEAAKLQGKFWEFHDAIFGMAELGDSAIERAAKQVGLDWSRLQADIQTGRCRNSVVADIAVGAELGVDGTPAVFINGRRVRRLGVSIIETILLLELRPDSP